MGFLRQEYWGGLPFPPSVDLPDPGIKLRSPVWQTNSLPLSHLGSLEETYPMLISPKMNAWHCRPSQDNLLCPDLFPLLETALVILLINIDLFYWLIKGSFFIDSHLVPGANMTLQLTTEHLKSYSLECTSTLQELVPACGTRFSIWDG